MALKLYERYPQLWESPSNDYPQGAFKNLSAQGETDGSYLEKDWLNDYSGFFGALLRNAEMTPDGTVDTAQRSQFYDALVKVAKSAVADQGYATKTYVDNKFNEVPKTEIINDWDQASDENVFSAGFVSKLINQGADGNTIIKSGLQTFTFPSMGNGGEVALTSYVDAQIEAIPESDSIPVGMVQAFIGETAPNDKWLLCRGQAFSAESYPDLAQLLPDLKIPDLRGVALRGLDANRGFDPARSLLSYQEDAMQQIYGSFQRGGVFGAIVSGAFMAGNTVAGLYGTGASDYAQTIDFDSSLVTRTNTQDETVMKNVAVNFIIKAR